MEIALFFPARCRPLYTYSVYLLSLYATQMEQKRSVWAADKPEETESVILPPNRKWV